MLLHFAALCGFALVLGLPDVARPCSVANGPLPGGRNDGATVGPRPLVFGHADSMPVLYRVDDPAQAHIALVRDDFEPELFVGVHKASAWRPAEPLMAGEHRVDGVVTSIGDDTFFVDPDLVAPPLGLGPVRLSVILHEPEGEGCFGASDSCGDVDFTRFIIELAPTTAVDDFLLAIENPRTGGRRVELVQTGFAPHTIFGHDNPDRFPGSLKRDRLCFSLTPISEGGTVGQRMDLGCVRPSPDDPRVDDQRGCAGGAHGVSQLTIWLAALVVARGRLRRR